MATIGVNYKLHYLGCYDTIQEAAEARKEAEERFRTLEITIREKKEEKKKQAARWRWRRYAEKKRNERMKEGKCRQCGKDWVEPIQIGKRKPKHCRNCQDYYRRRYDESKAKRRMGGLDDH